MTVFAPTLGALWRHLEGYGIDPEPIFREEDIDPEVMFDQGARVSIERFQRIDLKGYELSGDPFYGLKGSEYFRPAHLGALGFSWLASSTLRTAFERLSRYARVIQERLSVELEENDDEFTVTIDPHTPILRERIREDGQLSVLIRMSRIIAGPDLNQKSVTFKQKEPADTGYHYQLFRCPLEFGSQTTSMTFHRNDVDRKLTGSNDELARLNEHIVVRYLAHSEKEDIVNRVKAAIIDNLANGNVNETSTSEQLHMTPRNMHRRLQEEQTSFKTLLTEVRKDLAKQYIQDRSKTLTEISFLLGFSEVSSFSRAYKGWTGKPPSEARSELS